VCRIVPERAEYVSGIVEALKEAGDPAAADSLGRRYRSGRDADRHTLSAAGRRSRFPGLP